LCVAAFLHQVTATTPQASKSRPAKSAAPKRTPQQLHGLKMLRVAETEAAGLSPDMRAFLLFEIGSAYQQINPAKARLLRWRAFEASTAIEDDDNGGDSSESNKSLIQQDLLNAMEASSPVELEKAIPRAIPELRNSYTAQLVRWYAITKQYDRALELIRQVAGDGPYAPYYMAAATLMVNLPEERAVDRQTIFQEALAAYENASSKDQMRFEDMGTLVVRFWDRMPPDLVMQAIDDVLDRAKESDADSHMQVEISSLKGPASFDSLYSMRLFELLPIIKSLDPSKAEQLLRENPASARMLERYPQGMRSLDSGLTGDSIGKTRQLSFSMHPAGASNPWNYVELERQGEEIRELARTDAKAAVDKAMSQPIDNCRRAQTVVSLGQILAARRSESSNAKRALNEAIKLSDDCNPLFRVENLRTAAEAFLAMADDDDAMKTIELGIKLAEEWYEKDSDASDPNLALKAQWPSTNAWRQFMQLVARISPDAATRLINDVQDPEIRVFLRVSMASGLLGSELPHLQVISRHRDNLEYW
jgi:tetratricopeptide (TPR) repeat protein